jgi:arylsulfatase A-like enzyme
MTLARHVHQHNHTHDHKNGHHHSNPAEAAPPDPPPADGIPRPPADIRLLLQQLLQSDPPRDVPDVSYPFCRGDDVGEDRGVTRPNVLLVDVSGLGARELAARDERGRPLLPRASALAVEESSFDDIHAPSTTAFPGLLAALSGLPPIVDVGFRPDTRALVPVPHLPGLAADLHRVGYATAAFSSEHLALDDRGLLFERVGFDEVFGPSLAPGAPARAGDGRADDATLEALFGWVRAHREAAADKPYLALATLQSARIPAGGDVNAGLTAVDALVGRLLDWYRAEEAERGTILVLLSDHASQRPEPAIAEGAPAEHRARFDVPLVVVGLRDARETQAAAARARNGGLLDLPQTVLALADVGARGCHQGVDLLQPEATWPTRRITLSFAGPSQRTLVAHDGDHRWLMPRSADRASLFNVVEDAALTDDLWSETDADWAQMKELRDAYLAVGVYLSRHDRFVPKAPPEGAPRARVEAPARVASLQLAAESGAAFVRADALESVARAGFTRARVPVAVTADGVPVLAFTTRVEQPVESMTAAAIAALPNPPLTLRDALSRFGRRVELELVIAPQRMADPARILDDLRAIVAVTSARGVAEVRFSTPSPAYAYALAQGTERPVGLELGPHERDAAWLDVAADLGCTFVTLPVAIGDALAVQRAHNRRLELAVEGVRVEGDLVNYTRDLPDAVAYQELPEG